MDDKGYFYEEDPDLRAAAEEARRAYSEARANRHYAEAEPPSPGLWVDDDTWNEADLPPREWVAPGYALRGAVTVLVGPPSAMKFSLMLAWCCALALGREYGRFQPAAPGISIVYNVEDDATEHRRRLSAELRQFDLVPADIAGHVVRTGPAGVGQLFEVGEGGVLRPTTAMRQLRDLVADRRPDMLIVDPLAELHRAEENDNTAVRAVIAEFRSLAVEFNMAVILVHHTRKGAAVPGDPDSARGASAIIGAARIVKTLIGMSEQDAEALGLPKERKSRSFYVRLDDAKQNYAGIEEGEWYEKVLYRIGNGEVIAAAVPWKAPDMWQAITTSMVNGIFDVVEAGIDDSKRRFTDNNAAEDRAAWAVVQRHVPSLSEQQCRAALRKWIETGMLVRKPYDDPVDRKKRTGLLSPSGRERSIDACANDRRWRNPLAQKWLRQPTDWPRRKRRWRSPLPTQSAGAIRWRNSTASLP